MLPTKGFNGVVRRRDKRIAIEYLEYKTAFRRAKAGSERLRSCLNILLADELPAAFTENNLSIYLDRHSGSPTRVVADNIVPFILDRQKYTGPI